MQVQPCLSQADTERVMHLFITSRLDYFNSLLSGLPRKAISQSLHCLPVSFRIYFKIFLLVYKSLHRHAPEYVSDMLSRYTRSRSLRSSATELLTVPKAKTKILYMERQLLVSMLPASARGPKNGCNCGNL